MSRLEIITKIPELEPDGIIRIRPGESTIVRIDRGDTAPPVPEIHGRPAEWREKTIPALVIVISEDPFEIFRVFKVPEDPEDAVPFLALSPESGALLRCRAEGKVLIRLTADSTGGSSEPMQYLHDIIAKTEYCFFLCSRRNPAWIQLAAEIAENAREQHTLTVMAFIGEGSFGSYENYSDILKKFHTLILPTDNSFRSIPIPLEQIRDFCEATMNDVVASGDRCGLVSGDCSIVRDLLFNGGISYSGGHTAGEPDAQELVRGLERSLQEDYQSQTGGTYSILKIPWESTIDAAMELRTSLFDILGEMAPSRFPHQIRIEGYFPEAEGQYDLNIWSFTGKSGFL
jgi:hypothetical protein